jgi:hypothetical protein
MSENFDRVEGFIGSGEMRDISQLVRVGKYAMNAAITLLGLWSVGILNPPGEHDHHNLINPDGHLIGSTLTLAVAEGIRRIGTRT